MWNSFFIRLVKFERFFEIIKVHEKHKFVIVTYKSNGDVVAWWSNILDNH